MNIISAARLLKMLSVEVYFINRKIYSIYVLKVVWHSVLRWILWFTCMIYIVGNTGCYTKHDMRAYLILYSVKWKYWNDLVSKVFGFVFGKMKVLEWLGREKAIFVYMPTSLINGKFELVPWCETWYVNLFGFVFDKMKVLESLKFELVPWCIT